MIANRNIQFIFISILLVADVAAIDNVNPSNDEYVRTLKKRYKSDAALDFSKSDRRKTKSSLKRLLVGSVDSDTLAGPKIGGTISPPGTKLIGVKAGGFIPTVKNEAISTKIPSSMPSSLSGLKNGTTMMPSSIAKGGEGLGSKIGGTYSPTTVTLKKIGGTKAPSSTNDYQGNPGIKIGGTITPTLHPSPGLKAGGTKTPSSSPKPSPLTRLKVGGTMNPSSKPTNPPKTGPKISGTNRPTSHHLPGFKSGRTKLVPKTGGAYFSDDQKTPKSKGQPSQYGIGVYGKSNKAAKANGPNCTRKSECKSTPKNGCDEKSPTLSKRSSKKRSKRMWAKVASYDCTASNRSSKKAGY